MTSVLGFFFFQAEDGIRDRTVTGVQTCAFRASPSNAARVFICRLLLRRSRAGPWASPGERYRVCSRTSIFFGHAVPHGIVPGALTTNAGGPTGIRTRPSERRRQRLHLAGSSTRRSRSRCSALLRRLASGRRGTPGLRGPGEEARQRAQRRGVIEEVPVPAVLDDHDTAPR